MVISKVVTQQYLKTVLHYNPETGIFVWLEPGRGRKNDLSAGSLGGSGYCLIQINGKRYYAHRLAFIYMTDQYPDEIDHINQTKDDNRWCNLRKCTTSQNHANISINKNNTSGYKGVCWHKWNKKWCAQIRINRKKYHIGYFACKHEAARAYNITAMDYFGDFAYLNKIFDF